MFTNFFQINGIATLIGLFMPAYFLECAKYVEDGCNFINDQKIDKLMEISTDGVIKLCKNKDSCYSTITNMEDCDMIVEIKCSYPNNHNLPVHYSLPKKYVTQMLAGMKCKRSLNCIYVCYSKESTTFFKCKFNNDLWKIL